MARAKLLWEPGAMEGFTARLTYTRDDRNGPYMYSYAREDVPDFYSNRINRSDYPNSSDAVADLATMELQYAIRDHLSLTAVTAWSSIDMARSFDSDLTELDQAYGGTDERYDTFSEELRLNYESDRLRALAGLHVSRREMDNFTGSRTNVETPVGTVAAVLQSSGVDAATANFIATMYGQALPVIAVDYSSDAESRSQNLALFSDFEMALAGRLSLLGGFRYDREEYRLGAETIADFAGTLPDPASFGPSLAPAIAGINQAVLGLVQQANSTTPENTRDFRAFLPKLGMRYEWSDDLSSSLVFQRGYRSGGSSFNIARGANFAYEPEFTWNAEASLRSLWLDDTLALNANLYYIDWEDKQVIAFFGLSEYDYHTVNAGKAHLYGLELESSHRIGPAFDWYAALGYSRTQ